MKIFKIILFVVILVVAFYIYINYEVILEKLPLIVQTSTSTNPQLSKYVQSNGGHIISVKDNEIVLIKFNYPSLIGMQKAVYDVAIESYDIFSKPLRVEGYYNNKPVLALETNNPNDENNLFFEDIRTPEFMIETDIAMFDVLVDDVRIIDSQAIIKLEYYGSQEDFADDFAGINFVAIQDVPWLETITINYVKPGICFNVKTTTDNVLKYYNDEISAESFMSNLEIESCSTELATENNNDEEITSDSVGGLVCSTDEKQAYQEYITAYNKLTDLMSLGQGDTPAAQAAYEPYKFYKECYEKVQTEVSSY